MAFVQDFQVCNDEIYGSAMAVHLQSISCWWRHGTEYEVQLVCELLLLVVVLVGQNFFLKKNLHFSHSQCCFLSCSSPLFSQSAFSRRTASSTSSNVQLVHFGGLHVGTFLGLKTSLPTLSMGKGICKLTYLWYHKLCINVLLPGLVVTLCTYHSVCCSQGFLVKKQPLDWSWFPS